MFYLHLNLLLKITHLIKNVYLHTFNYVNYIKDVRI